MAGMQVLANEGVDRIVTDAFFLSPCSLKLNRALVPCLLE